MDMLQCGLCPRECRSNRSEKEGFCGVGNELVVAKAFLHKWEEPCISGENGSGTVFFSGCNLKCVYCQNHKISQENFGKKISIERLSSIFLELQGMGAHNINLVNPSHFVPHICEAIKGAHGLNIPVVYNSNGYDSIDMLERISGLVNVFLPDLKYMDNSLSSRYSTSGNYFSIASKALLKMYSQVGGIEFDKNGMLKKGLIVRHLILPGHTKDSIAILKWIKENLSADIIVSLMSQYIPYYKTGSYPEIDRRLTRREHERVVDYFVKLDFNNGFYQERCSAEEEFIPEFDLSGVN